MAFVNLQVQTDSSQASTYQTSYHKADQDTLQVTNSKEFQVKCLPFDSSLIFLKFQNHLFLASCSKSKRYSEALSLYVEFCLNAYAVVLVLVELTIVEFISH
jgi:hypothetical protein